MKIATCIPKQFYTFDEKINWLEEQIKIYQPDIFITPQEYFGGDYIMPEQNSFTEEELLPSLLSLSNKYNVGLIVGLIERDLDGKYERMWFIDKELKGKITKFAEPAYSLKGMGSYSLQEEDNLDNRFQSFEIKGVIVSGYFCWEVYSDLLFAGLGLLDLDLLVSQIKFGIASSPKKDKVKGLIRVGGFNYWKDNSWKRRIQMINEFEVKCPIAISTNSWNLDQKSEPLYGVQDVFSKNEMKIGTNEQIKDGVVEITELNIGKVRGTREHWSKYLERNGEMPPGFLREYTMMWKIHNREKRILGKSQREKLYSHLKKNTFYKRLLNEGDELSRMINRKK